MNKGKTYIDIVLNSPNCLMISPGYEYSRWLAETKKKERNPDNLKRLEALVSSTMTERYQKEIKEAIENTVPSLYIDCRNKGEDDIMLFLFKEYIRQSKAKNKQEIVLKNIGRHTIVTENKVIRDEYLNNNKPTIDEALQYYIQSLKTNLEKNQQPGYKNMLLNFESDITFHGMSELMRSEWQKYLNLYLDKVQSLSLEEQQRINTILYTRGSIGRYGDRRIRLKINNGEWSWKTRYSSIGHRIEAIHDYSEVYINENELDQAK